MLRGSMARMKYAAALAAASAAAWGWLAGCGSSNGGNDPKTFFTTKVYPAVEPTCAGCHATGKDGAPVFLADNADGSYGAIEAMPGLVAVPSVSPLIQHGAHLGPALTDVQASLVSQWLIMEAGPDTGRGAAPTDLMDALRRFGQCMDYDEWISLRLDQIAQTSTSDGAHCTSCHNEGTGGLFLSGDAADDFMHFTEFPYVERLATGQVNDQGQFNGLIGADRLIDKGSDSRQLNANNHPYYDDVGEGTGIEPATLDSNLRNFVAHTIDKVNSGDPCSSETRPDAGADSGDDAY